MSVLLLLLRRVYCTSFIKMNRFVRPSKYRHVFGTTPKRDFCYDNVRVSLNAWDSNMVQVNPVSTMLSDHLLLAAF